MPCICLKTQVKQILYSFESQMWAVGVLDPVTAFTSLWASTIEMNLLYFLSTTNKYYTIW